MRKVLALLFALLAAPAGAQVIPSGQVGSLNYWGVGGLSQVLNPGLAGQCLTTQGVGSAPVWVNCQVSSLSLLPPINTNQFYGNVSGQFAPPVGVDVNTILNTVGYDIARPPAPESIIYKSNVGPLFNWQALPPGPTGAVLTSGGPTNPPSWLSPNSAGLTFSATAPITYASGNFSLATNGVTNPFLAQMPATTTKCNPLASTANAQDCAIFTIPSLTAGVALNGSELFQMYQGAYPYNSISSSVMKQYFANTGCATTGGALFNSGSNTIQCSSAFTFGTTSFTSPDGNTWTSTGLTNNGNSLTLTNNGSAAFIPLLFSRAPNLTAGQVGFIEIGHDETNNNVVQWQFGFVGAGSASNYLCTQFWGGVCLLKITAGGVITAGGALLSTTASGGVGYTTGAGGAVTQATSRTTGVTLNNITGAVTLFAAAPVVGTPVSFTVTDSSVAATDVVVASVKSATNTYEAIVTATAAGSFQLTITSLAGTTSDSPVVNFAVIKGSAN